MNALSPDNEMADELVELTRSISRAYFMLKTFGEHIGFFHEYGSNVTEIVNLLYQHGPHSISDIARLRGISRQFVVKLARQFEARGMVSLEPNAADKRGYIMKLTPEGVAEWETNRLIFRDGLSAIGFRLKVDDLRSVRASIDMFAEDIGNDLRARARSSRGNSVVSPQRME